MENRVWAIITGNVKQGRNKIMSQETRQSKFTKTHAVMIVASLVIAALVGVIAFLLLKPEEKAPGSGALVVDESNLAEIKESIESKESEGMFEVNMNTQWNFPTGDSASSNAYLANGGANHLPLSFEIILENEVIYSSTVIPVGNRIKEIVLDKDLDAGVYDAVCQYTLWNEDGTEDSSFGVNLQLIIDN